MGDGRGFDGEAALRRARTVSHPLAGCSGDQELRGISVERPRRRGTLRNSRRRGYRARGRAVLELEAFADKILARRSARSAPECRPPPGTGTAESFAGGRGGPGRTGGLRAILDWDGRLARVSANSDTHLELEWAHGASVAGTPRHPRRSRETETPRRNHAARTSSDESESSSGCDDPGTYWEVRARRSGGGVRRGPRRAAFFPRPRRRDFISRRAPVRSLGGDGSSRSRALRGGLGDGDRERGGAASTPARRCGRHRGGVRSRGRGRVGGIPARLVAGGVGAQAHGSRVGLGRKTRAFHARLAEDPRGHRVQRRRPASDSRRRVESRRGPIRHVRRETRQTVDAAGRGGERDGREAAKRRRRRSRRSREATRSRRRSARGIAAHPGYAPRLCVRDDRDRDGNRAETADALCGAFVPGFDGDMLVHGPRRRDDARVARSTIGTHGGRGRRKTRARVDRRRATRRDAGDRHRRERGEWFGDGWWTTRGAWRPSARLWRF